MMPESTRQTKFFRIFGKKTKKSHSHIGIVFLVGNCFWSANPLHSLSGGAKHENKRGVSRAERRGTENKSRKELPGSESEPVGLADDCCAGEDQQSTSGGYQQLFGVGSGDATRYGLLHENHSRSVLD